MNIAFRIALAVVGSLAVAAALAAVGLYYYLLPQIPSRQQIEDIHLQVPLRVYSRGGRLLAEFGERQRIPVPYDRIPKRIVSAVIAAEDDKFFEHSGVDYVDLARAAFYLVLTGEKRQGGSTITMQLARNVFLTPKKTYIRKIKEIMLARRINSVLTKQKVLDLYLNKIYLGEGAYGIAAAARIYYGKSLEQLTLPEIAMIAGLPQAPSTDNPIVNPAHAKIRRNYVLGRMYKLGDITKDEFDTAIAAPLTAGHHGLAPQVNAPYVAEMVRAQMYDSYGDQAYTAGYSVYTTIDAQQQAAANEALHTALIDYSVRHGYRGPEGHVSADPLTPESIDVALSSMQPVAGMLPAVVTTVRKREADVYLGNGKYAALKWDGLAWARRYIDADHRGPAPQKATDILNPGDIVRVRRSGDGWQLAQVPQVQGALVAMDPANGAVRALVGGFDFGRSQFNRAVQAERQPGSGFKPFIYSAALHKGFTAASLINDAPVVLPNADQGGAWRPENYSDRFHGPIRLREALVHSINLASIRVLRDIGIGYATDYVTRFGFARKAIPQDLSMALGSMSVTPLQMATAYAVFANGGYHVDSHYIVRIQNEQGQTVFRANDAVAGTSMAEATTPAPPPMQQAAFAPGQAAADTPPVPPTAPRVLSAQNDYLMYSMMQDVIREGTGRAARSLGRHDLAGKTGTANDQRDAWFNGFSPALVAVAWVGFDDTSPLGFGETGAHAALPMWKLFMRQALQGVPDQPLPQPSGLVAVRIDARTGQAAGAEDPHTLFETFRSRYAPKPATSDSGGPAPVGAHLF